VDTGAGICAARRAAVVVAAVRRRPGRGGAGAGRGTVGGRGWRAGVPAGDLAEASVLVAGAECGHGWSARRRGQEVPGRWPGGRLEVAVDRVRPVRRLAGGGLPAAPGWGAGRARHRGGARSL